MQADIPIRQLIVIWDGNDDHLERTVRGEALVLDQRVEWIVCSLRQQNDAEKATDIQQIS